jgi:ribosome-binding protein aMBF1 (putative translation factor)
MIWSDSMGFWDIFSNKCEICKRKTTPLRKYYNEKGKVIKLCLPCSQYAERRAYRIKK